VHPYASDPARVLRIVRNVRTQMAQGGDRRKPIWITEVGWATGGATGTFLVTSRAGQAARLRATYRLLLRARRRYRIGMAVWFSWRDRAPGPREGNWWGINTGLFKRNGTPKPAWRAYASVAGGS
jgi:exo-beta-1,3-glucanase (GH17 family)